MTTRDVLNLVRFLFLIYTQALAMKVEEAYAKTHILCIYFLATGIIVFLAAVAQTFWFSKASINLTTRVR